MYIYHLLISPSSGQNKSLYFSTLEKAQEFMKKKKNQYRLLSNITILKDYPTICRIRCNAYHDLCIDMIISEIQLDILE